MFELLTGRIKNAVDKLTGAKRLSEKQVNKALREIRLALLEADVDPAVVKSFIKRLREKTLKAEVIKGLNPGETVLKIVYDELTDILGKNPPELKKGVVLLVGLQGTGKTTTIGKLANWLKKKGHSVAVSSTDIRRPAAMLQLKKLAQSVGVKYYDFEGYNDPIQIAREAVKKANEEGVEYLLLDTAGRLHIDEELMEELKKLKQEVNPSEVIYVADAMQGQEALPILKEFHEKLGLTGVVLTKMDGDARGGLALSVKEAVGVPIKFVGVGEKLEDLEPFYPDRMAQRILGLGDLQSLIEKAQGAIPEDEAKELATKVLQGEFTLEDLKKQLEFMLKMGPLDKLLKMIPGLAPYTDKIKVDEKLIKRKIAIINSMTPEERRNPNIINLFRKRRIAKGSGTTVQDVNRLLKEYKEMKKFLKRFKINSFGRKRGGFPFKFPFPF
ncbi:MAG TPA: signal recognition particle protein [Aquifex aeolicus]|uniref:Signal recognition particle protein n=1 Tax=Aquifex aeolicus TaxID=63363 RepID=A0A9D1CG75_AQUAO|nr:signal recognition particle protein [Aquifex aeolicus]